MSWRTLRELDEAAGRTKGAAFRAFRALEPGLVDGVDYRVLDTGPEFEALRGGPRVYASHVKIILLTPATALRVLAALR